MIRFGTCSWAEKTLIRSGEFYPRGVNTAEERLRYYSSVFDVVEVDSSFYAIPAQRTVAQWAERTPAGFVFHVKAYSLLTGHSADLGSIPPEVRDMLSPDAMKKGRVAVREQAPLEAVFSVFTEAIRPLKETGKMGLSVFQFSAQFMHKPENLDYMLFCREAMGDIPMGVEFRNGSWLAPDHNEEVFSFLRDHGITYIAADEPQYGSLATVPFIPAVTTDIAYFRFHGRNRENWLKKGIETSQRYEYSYSDQELEEFVPTIMNVSGKAKETYVMFNNHGSPGIRNAAALRQRIAEKTGRKGIS